MVHQNSICKTTAIAASFTTYSDSEHYDVWFFPACGINLGNGDNLSWKYSQRFPHKMLDVTVIYKNFIRLN